MACEPVDCGCDAPAETPSPVLPRCQDIVLTPGVYENATIVVNAQGCIEAVTTGSPEPYTPPDCCDGVAASSEPGPRGFTGPAGPAATITILPLIQGSGPEWTQVVTGDANNAIIQFTAPAVPEEPDLSGYATLVQYNTLAAQVTACCAAGGGGGGGGGGTTWNNGTEPISITWTMPSGEVRYASVPPGGSLSLPLSDPMYCDTSPQQLINAYNTVTGAIFTSWTIGGALACGGGP